MRKTKIVATLGPASSDEHTLKQLMLAGVNVFRLNFSHGTHQIHAQTLSRIDKLNAELGLHVATLADLSGPKIRTGEVEGNAMLLKPGEQVLMTTRSQISAQHIISVGYNGFARDVKAGERILLDDGKIMLQALESNQIDEVVAKVIQGGMLSSNKGINLPNTRLSLPTLSEKDLDDLNFILQHNIEWIALSFVRTAADIEGLRRHILDKCKMRPPKIMAKIEKPEAVENALAIIRASDAIMVARGDLGVEIPQEQVPIVQKKFIHMSIAASKPIVVATQMMEGMITNMRPTRAEVSDVANSVIDGADALMLSGETSVGSFPVETVETMSRIIMDVENSGLLHAVESHTDSPGERRISDAVIRAARDLAQQVKATAIIGMTHSGYSAFKLSSFRPGAGIFIFASDHYLLNMMNLLWGVTPVYYDKFSNTDTALTNMRKILINQGHLQKGDYFIHISSIPIGKPGKTNMLKLSQV
ncbi:Pyruvate kinase [anaerobic digester metagenome]|nr:pyruvate kinase [Lentimicrobiaceae bacterium]